MIVLGCVIEIFSAIIVVAPLVVPVAHAFGVDPVHLGVIMLASLELGYLMPPIGLNLLMSASRFQRPMLEVARATLPMFFVLAFGVALITLFPAAEPVAAGPVRRRRRPSAEGRFRVRDRSRRGRAPRSGRRVRARCRRPAARSRVATAAARAASSTRESSTTSTRSRVAATSIVRTLPAPPSAASSAAAIDCRPWPAGALRRLRAHPSGQLVRDRADDHLHCVRGRSHDAARAELAQGRFIDGALVSHGNTQPRHAGVQREDVRSARPAPGRSRPPRRPPVPASFAAAAAASSDSRPGVLRSKRAMTNRNAK